MSNRHHAHRRTARAGITALITACLLFTAPPRNIAATLQQTEVYLLGSLYRRHETVAAYDLATLRRIIAAIAPDVLVVDCTPREVNEEKVHASKVEYPGVIFPMARERKLRMYAAEPDEPMFTEIVQSIVEAQARLEKERPDASAGR